MLAVACLLRTYIEGTWRSVAAVPGIQSLGVGGSAKFAFLPRHLGLYKKAFLPLNRGYNEAYGKKSDFFFDWPATFFFAGIDPCTELPHLLVAGY